MNKINQTKLSISIAICIAILLIIAACAAIIFSTNAQADSQNYGDHVPGEVIACVETDPYFGETDNSNSSLKKINDQMNSFLSNYNCETLLCFTGNDVIYNTIVNDNNMITVKDVSDSKTKPAQTRYVKIKFDENQKSMNQMIKELESISIVKYAQPNNSAQLYDGTTPDFTNSQYAYDNENASGTTHNKVGMNVPNWNTSTPNILSDKQAVVAIIDTGVDYNHPDIQTADKVYGNLQEKTGMGGEHGYNASAVVSEGEDDTDPMDLQGHGTHCSGIIASQWNDFGVSGGANVCSILPVKIQHPTKGIYNDAIIRAYGYVINAKQKADINVVAINNSWGSEENNTFISDLVTKAGQGNNKIISVFASGNDSKNTDNNMYTAYNLKDNPYCLIVNSSNELGYKSPFSNYGLSSTDVFAPGHSIYSTIPSWEKEDGSSLMSSDIRYMQPNEYDIKDDFEKPSNNWTFKYYSDEACTQEITAVGESQGYGDGKALFVSGKDSPTVNPNKVIYVTGDYSQLTTCKRLAFVFKTMSQCKNSDSSQCSIFDANNPGSGNIGHIGTSPASSGNAYFPISAPVSKIKNVDGKFKIAVKFWYWDEWNNNRASDYYIDNISTTNKQLPYYYDSGTSMASPACCGMVAVLSANNNTEPAEKIVARIKGGTNRKSWLADYCYTGGIVDLGRASSSNADSDLDPVVLDAKLVSSADNTSTVKISGYFLGDSSSNVTVNGIPATNILADKEGDRQVFTCTFPSKLSGLIAVKVDKNEKSLTRYYNVGNNDDELLERVKLPDSNNPEFTDFYAAVANDLKYATDNYLYFQSSGSTGTFAFICDLNSQQWRKFDFSQQIYKAFVEKGINPLNISYLCGKDNIVVYSCYEQETVPGFAYYDLSTGEITVDLVELFAVPAFGYWDDDVIYFGGTNFERQKCICSYNPEKKEFKEISTVDDWGIYPIMYKIEDGKFLLIDVGNILPLMNTFTNDMYLLSINDEQNGHQASIVKLDQEAFPTLVEDQTQNKMTGHAIVGGKLMMTGPSNIDKDTHGVVADTFLRNIETKEEVALPGLLSNSKAFQSVSAGSGDYVFTYFVDSQGPAIAKRYVGSPVPPTPDPTPTPQADSLNPVSTAATGDNTLSALFAIVAIAIAGGFVLRYCKISTFDNK